LSYLQRRNTTVTTAKPEDRRGCVLAISTYSIIHTIRSSIWPL